MYLLDFAIIMYFTPIVGSFFTHGVITSLYAIIE